MMSTDDLTNCLLYKYYIAARRNGYQLVANQELLAVGESGLI